MMPLYETVNYQPIVDPSRVGESSVAARAE